MLKHVLRCTVLFTLGACRGSSPSPARDASVGPSCVACGKADVSSAAVDLSTTTATSTDSGAPVDLAGGGAMASGPSLGGCPIFPADNAWNQNISSLPVHPHSAAYVASVGDATQLHPDFSSTQWNNGYGYGIPYTLVPGSQPKVPISFYDYPSQSDPGPYPIPDDVHVEGGLASDGDRHILVLDTGSCYLYEVFAVRRNGSAWEGSCGAIWHLREDWTRPAGWTSADAAGLPILAGLVRYDEVQAGEIRHALRFTASSTQRGYIAPASHEGSSSTDTNRPPMGLRMRLKASVDISGYPTRMQVILRALKRYGMLLADNGGNWYLSGVPDSHWDDAELETLKHLSGSDFEAVDTGPIHY